MPVKQEQILKYARRRNPFNRQTIAFKKAAAVKAGGYSDLKLCEDYEFIVRMLQNGAVGQNIPETLVRYRTYGGDFKKRGSWKQTKGFIKVRRIIHSSGFFFLCRYGHSLRLTAWTIYTSFKLYRVGL